MLRRMSSLATARSSIRLFHSQPANKGCYHWDQGEEAKARKEFLAKHKKQEILLCKAGSLAASIDLRLQSSLNDEEKQIVNELKFFHLPHRLKEHQELVDKIKQEMGVREAELKNLYDKRSRLKDTLTRNMSEIEGGKDILAKALPELYERYQILIDKTRVRLEALTEELKNLERIDKSSPAFLIDRDYEGEVFRKLKL